MRPSLDRLLGVRAPRALLFVLLATQVAWAGPYKLTVVTDRPEALYAVGEKARFQISLQQDDKPVAPAEVAWVLDKDGMPPVQRGTLKLENGAATIAGSLAEPGFLTCRVTFTDPERKAVLAIAAAGYDPLKIAPSVPVPDDFDAFWARKKGDLRAEQPQPALTPVTSPNAAVDCWDIQVNCLSWRPVSAYLAKPKGAAPKSLPIILSVHGAGVRSSQLGAAAGLAAGYQALAMDLNANGIANGKPDAWYKEQADTVLRDYRYQGRDDRDKCYFLGMFLRLVRALDYLCAQPEWDGRRVVVTGGSQGGGQALAAAGLDERVTLLCAGVPAICDHSGKAIGRVNGWPRLVPDVDGKPDPKILAVARYFDCQHLATRAKAGAVVSVGFIDGVCPPTSVYAAYNALPGKKAIVNESLMGHSSTPRTGKAMGDAIKAHLAGK
jgi:cephalosporin-C deacetylase-like acetyl esterase